MDSHYFLTFANGCLKNRKVYFEQNAQFEKNMHFEVEQMAQQTV